MKYCLYFLKTIFDVGLFRITGRCKYEVKKLIFKYIPSQISKIYTKSNIESPKFKRVLTNLNLKDLYFNKKLEISKTISFNFLNDKKDLLLPFDWNSSEFSQLWRFNLHYFDWAREWLEFRLKYEIWPEESKSLSYLINNWIDNNKTGYGDGWHSYTISLRIRNWILIFRVCPELSHKKNLNSLWQQLCWLHKNKEDFLGGNHFLENLISLVVGSIQFEGEKAEYIYKDSINQLQKELENQILDDGGHEERSASYHLLILERLVELGLILENINGERPKWLISTIQRMLNWTLSIRLINGKYPTFNDSPDICNSIDKVVEISNSYLNRFRIKDLSIQGILSKFYKSLYKKDFKYFYVPKDEKLVELRETGWIIARLGRESELIFKIGDSCPKHLPAHAHSDLLSFDLFHKGEPIIVETGTSTYGNNKVRYYERSGSAHNIMQLAPFKNQKLDSIKWIEPIQVWGNFRAARKAIVLNKCSGYLANGTIWMSGSNDANNKYGAKYERTLEIKNSDKYVTINVCDEIVCKNKMYWRQTWHLGPNQPTSILYNTIYDLNTKYNFDAYWHKTWYSQGFGKRIERNTLQLIGVINPGVHQFINNIILPHD